MWPWWLYGLALVSLAVLMALEPAIEGRIWAIVLGLVTPIFMFVGMEVVIDRGRDANAMAGASTILIACMIAFTGFRPGLLARGFLAEDQLARKQIRYRIWSGWLGIAIGIVLAAWYAVANGA